MSKVLFASFQRVFGREPEVVATGQTQRIDARGYASLSLILAPGASATVTRVNTVGATSTVTEFPHAVDCARYDVTATAGPVQVELS